MAVDTTDVAAVGDGASAPKVTALAAPLLVGVTVGTADGTTATAAFAADAGITVGTMPVPSLLLATHMHQAPQLQMPTRLSIRGLASLSLSPLPAILSIRTQKEFEWNRRICR